MATIAILTGTYYTNIYLLPDCGEAQKEDNVIDFYIRVRLYDEFFVPS